jgi:hypothetical protein
VVDRDRALGAGLVVVEPEAGGGGVGPPRVTRAGARDRACDGALDGARDTPLEPGRGLLRPRVDVDAVWWRCTGAAEGAVGLPVGSP